MACIIDDSGKLLGVLTDGDIRRKLLKIQKPFSAFFVDDALDHAEKNPTVTRSEEILSSAVAQMETKGIWDLPVVNDEQILVGLLHLHPVVKTLIAKI
jgi:DeoR family transcriptional regulator, catabolite repression regulator